MQQKIIEYSPREKQILELLSQGYVLKQIAAKLNVHVDTIYQYNKSIVKKSGTTLTATVLKFQASKQSQEISK